MQKVKKAAAQLDSRTAFDNYLNHKNYISPIIKACYS